MGRSSGTPKTKLIATRVTPRISKIIKAVSASEGLYASEWVRKVIIQELRARIIADLANSFPKVNVIMLHTTMANSAATELLQVKVAKKNPNIWFETCFSSPYIIKNIVKQIGADRIMYGSDHSSLVGSSNFPSIYERVEYEMMMQIYYIRCLELPKDQEDKIMGLNAARLFGVEINK
jgi:predicted TIM-barrel fold metal-dependent hydrolase